MVTVANDRADHMRDLPADPGRYGMPVRSLLGISSLRGASVLAGAAGLDREVRRVNVMEVPDILPWVKPHELLLTTGFPLRAASSAGGALNPGAFCRLVTDLDGRGLSAIAIKLGRYLDELPPAVLDVADKIGMPVLRVPDGVAFDDVITDVFTELVDRQSGAMARADDLHRALAAIVLEGGDLPQIADEVARCRRRACRHSSAPPPSPRWRSPSSSRCLPSRTSTAATTCATSSPATPATPRRSSRTARRSAGTSDGRSSWWSPSSTPRTSTARRRPHRSRRARHRSASPPPGSRSSAPATRPRPSWGSARRSSRCCPST